MKVSEIFIKSSEIIPISEIKTFVSLGKDQHNGCGMPQKGYTREQLIEKRKTLAITYYYKIDIREISVSAYRYVKNSRVNFHKTWKLTRWQMIPMKEVFRKLDAMMATGIPQIEDAFDAPISDILKWDFYKDIHNFMPKVPFEISEEDFSMCSEPMEAVRNEALAVTDSVFDSPASQEFAGKSIVISGIFENHSREAIREVIQLHGGKCTQQVSRTTAFVVAGAKIGPSKLNKAMLYGIDVLTEEQFFALLAQPMTSENNHRDSLLPAAEAMSVPVVEEAVSVPVVEESKKNYLRPYLTLIDLTMENMVACASDYNSPEEIFEKVDFKNEDVEAWMRFDTHAARELKVSTPTETFHSTAELKKKIEKLEAQLEAVRAERHELKKEVRALKKTIEDKDAIIYSEKRKNMILLSPEEFDRRAEEEERLAAAAQEAEVQAAAKAERKKKFFLFRDNRFLSYFFENRVSYLDGIFLLTFFVCLVSLLGTNCVYNGVSYLKEVLMTGISSFFISAISIGWKNTEPSEYTKNNNSCPSPKKSGETAKLVEHISEGLIDVLIGTLLGSGKGKRRKH